MIKSIRNVAFSVMLTLGAFTAMTVTSCNQDECKDVVCNNGGTCNDADGSCVCPTGFTGANCDTKVRDQFIGTWSGSDVCTGGTYNVTLSIASSSNDIQALINNPGGFGTSITINGVVSGANTLTFTNQNAGGVGRIINGSMTFTGSSMRFQYTVTDGVGGSDNCTGNYAKQ